MSSASLSLVELTVTDLRCIGNAQLSLHPRLNLLWGSNGSGKTSLLEGIFLLGRGRSFRTRNSERLIRHGQSKLTVFGRTDHIPPQTLGVQVAKAVRSRAASSSAASTLARINSVNAASLTELSQVFPVQVIDPGIHKLVEEGAFRRRRWLDWAVFHVEPSFGDDWLRYTRAVKQRNAALRLQAQQASAWDAEVAKLGEAIGHARSRLIAELRPFWQQSMLTLCGLELDLQYSRGWPQDSSLAETLVNAWPRDQARELTHNGPHRADIVLRTSGRPAREVLSRGQQKLVAIAMTLAQIRLLQARNSLTPTLLLDDPAAELDGAHLSRFIEAVSSLDCQLVLTSLQPHFDLFGRPDRVFHVEHGVVR